jgi:hypothetical protein
VAPNGRSHPALFFVLQFDPALAFGLIATVNGELAAIAILSSGHAY